MGSLITYDVIEYAEIPCQARDDGKIQIEYENNPGIACISMLS